jgi:hypothetical protein
MSSCKICSAVLKLVLMRASSIHVLAPFFRKNSKIKFEIKSFEKKTHLAVCSRVTVGCSARNCAMSSRSDPVSLVDARRLNFSYLCENPAYDSSAHFSRFSFVTSICLKKIKSCTVINLLCSKASRTASAQLKLIKSRHVQSFQNLSSKNFPVLCRFFKISSPKKR